MMRTKMKNLFCGVTFPYKIVVVIFNFLPSLGFFSQSSKIACSLWLSYNRMQRGLFCLLILSFQLFSVDTDGLVQQAAVKK